MLRLGMHNQGQRAKTANIIFGERTIDHKIYVSINSINFQEEY